jgi:hypothetical protein
MSLIVLSALLWLKMSSNFNCSYMAMSSLAYIYSGVFCEIFLSADLYLSKYA